MPWLHKSRADLERAGFVFKTEVPCARCNAHVLIFQRPEGGRIALELESLKPHVWRCPWKKSKKPKTAAATAPEKTGVL